MHAENGTTADRPTHLAVCLLQEAAPLHEHASEGAVFPRVQLVRTHEKLTAGTQRNTREAVGTAV